jgi:hypothetical protein|nr:MAG TPA_asm: hypothetical protein [Caudoviricetes sp.]
MSKSVLVIDTPENCRSCYLRGFTLNLQYCRGKLKDIKDTSVKPDWCPLKPLPEKNTTENDMTDYQCGMVDGRNQCIDEITGGMD